MEELALTKPITSQNPISTPHPKFSLQLGKDEVKFESLASADDWLIAGISSILSPYPRIEVRLHTSYHPLPSYCCKNVVYQYTIINATVQQKNICIGSL